MKIIRCSLIWACEATNVSSEQKYQKVLKSQLEGIDIEWTLRTLEEISNWCKYRNEIIHCLLNKNIHDVDANLGAMAEKGFQLARNIDSQVRALGKGNMIRRKMNLTIDKVVKVSKEKSVV